MVEPRPVLECLSLGGDGDDVEAVEALEAAFGVQFGDETANWFTVGDAYEAVLARVGAGSTPGLCATSMAFYRVRGLLVRLANGPQRIRPATPLAWVTQLSRRGLYQRLHAELGLEVRDLTLSASGCFGLACLLIGPASALIGHSPWPLILAPIGLLMIRWDSGAYGRMTVGDLAREVARDNFGRLVQQGADRRPDTIWRAVCYILGDQSGQDPARMASETRLVG